MVEIVAEAAGIYNQSYQMEDHLSYPAWKRLMDIIGSIIGIIAFLPFSVIVVIAIKLDTPGPIFERLERISGGNIIKVYKFRTMIRGAHSGKSSLIHLNERSDGCFFKIKNDPRVTRAGKILRKFRIDEVPQFLNVLSGEMALVGPRPHEPGEVVQYPDKYRHVPTHVAGITGLSQVSGASSLKWLDELALDDFYVRHRTFGMDAWVIMKTIGIFVSDHTGV